MTAKASTKQIGNISFRHNLNQFKIKGIHKVINVLLTIGLVLLPFSSSIDENSTSRTLGFLNYFEQIPVLSFGFPFLVFAAFFVFMSIGARETILHTRSTFLYGFIISCMLLSLLFAGVVGPPLFRISFQIIGLIISLYIMGMQVYRENLRYVMLKFFIKIFFLSGCILSSYFLINTAIKVSRYGISILATERGVGMLLSLPWGASNMISATLVLPLFAGIALLPFYESKERIFRRILVGIGVIILAILATLSRTSIAIVLISFLLLTLLNRSFKPAFGLSILLIVSYFAIGYITDSNAISYLFDQRLGDTNELLQVNGRLLIWENSITRFLNAPLTPIGYYNSIYKYRYSSHNFFLTVLIEQGIWGVLVNFMLVFFAFADISKSIKHKLDSVDSQIIKRLFCGLVAIVLNLQFEDANFTQPFSIIFWFYLGIVFLMALIIEGKYKTQKRGLYVPAEK